MKKGTIVAIFALLIGVFILLSRNNEPQEGIILPPKNVWVKPPRFMINGELYYALDVLINPRVSRDSVLSIDKVSGACNAKFYDSAIKPRFIANQSIAVDIYRHPGEDFYEITSINQ